MTVPRGSSWESGSRWTSGLVPDVLRREEGRKSPGFLPGRDRGTSRGRDGRDVLPFLRCGVSNTGLDLEDVGTGSRYPGVGMNRSETRTSPGPEGLSTSGPGSRRGGVRPSFGVLSETLLRLKDRHLATRSVNRESRSQRSVRFSLLARTLYHLTT